MNWDKIKNNITGAKGLATIGISEIVGTAISSLFWFYLASVIETGDFGQIHYFLGIAGAVYIITLFAGQSVITVYVSKNLKLESTLYFISLLTSIAGSFIIFFLFNRFDVSLIIIGFVVNDLAIGYLLGKKLYTKYTKYIILQKLLTVIFCVGLFHMIGLDGIIYGLFLSYIHFFIIIFKRFKDSEIKLSLLKPKLGFIINNYTMSLAGIFRNQFDKLLIGQMFGFSILGNYALAIQMFTVLMISSNIVTKYLLPEDASGNRNQKLKKLTFGLSVIIAILGFSILPLIIQAFFPKFVESIEIIRIMSLGVIFATVGQIHSSRLLGTEKSKHVVIGRWMSAAVMLAGIFTLGSIFSATGLAISFVLSTTTYVIYIVIIDNIKIKK